MAGVSRSYAQVARCPQVTGNGLLMDVRSDDGQHYRALRSPLAEFGTSTAGFIVSAGAQTEQILGELQAGDAVSAGRAVSSGKAGPAGDAAPAADAVAAGEIRESGEGHADRVLG